MLPVSTLIAHVRVSLSRLRVATFYVHDMGATELLS